MKQCSDRSSSPATLGVNNMLGKKGTGKRF